MKESLREKYLRTGAIYSTWRKYGFKHRAEIHPFRVIWVCPQLISDKTVKLLGGDDRIISHVLSGDWDVIQKPFVDRFMYKFMYAHFVESVPWTDIPYYQDILLQIRNRGCYWHGCRTEEDVLTRCAYLDSLYRDIFHNGYRVPRGLNYAKSGIALGARPEEVGIRIGRDGSLMHETGAHRLPITLLLKVDIIPVRVVVRHLEWQRFRDFVAKGRTGRERRDRAGGNQSHPDISYLL